MKDNESTVRLEEQELSYLEPKKPSLMMKLAETLKEEGVNAQVIRKMKFQ